MDGAAGSERADRHRVAATVKRRLSATRVRAELCTAGRERGARSSVDSILLSGGADQRSRDSLDTTISAWKAQTLVKEARQDGGGIKNRKQVLRVVILRCTDRMEIRNLRGTSSVFSISAALHPISKPKGGNTTDRCIAIGSPILGPSSPMLTPNPTNLVLATTVQSDTMRRPI